MVLKAATVTTAEQTKVIEAVALSSATRTIAMTGGTVILTTTASVTTQRPCNVSTRTTHMALTYDTGTFVNRPSDSSTRSPLGLAMVKAVEEGDAALVAAEAVDEAVVDSKAVAAFRAVANSKAVDAATIMIAMVAVARVITTEIKAHIMEAPHKDLTIRAMGVVTITTRTLLPVQPGQQNNAIGASFHNAPVPGTVMIPMQMAPSTAPGQQGNSGTRAAAGGQSSVRMGSSYGNFRG